MEHIASLFGLLVTIGRYLFLFLLYRFLWQIFGATNLQFEPETQGGDFFLVVTDLSDPDRSQRYVFQSELTVGHDPGNKVVLADPYAAGRHLRLWRQGESFFLKDLNTTSGTLLVGRPVPREEPVAFTPGEKIMIGTTQLCLEKAERRSLDRGGE